MRLLHTADLHLGKSLEGRQRYDEQEQVLAEIVTIARREDVDLVLIAGDVFDTYNPSAQAQELLFAFLHQLSEGGQRPVVIIAGNHDQPQRLSAVAPLAMVQNIYLIGLPNEEIFVDKSQNTTFIAYQDNCLMLRLPRTGEDVAILALPYISEARLNELFLQDISDEAQQKADYQQRLQQLLQKGAGHFSPHRINIIMAHLLLIGGQSSQSERPLGFAVAEENTDDEPKTVMVGGSFGLSPRIFPPQAQYIALGHLHRPQEIAQQSACHYAGSPLAYSFSEAGQSKSVVIADIEAGQPAASRRVALTCGYPLHKMEASNYEQALAWCLDENNHHLWVNVAIHSEKSLPMEAIAQLRKAHPRILDIIPLLPQMERLADQSLVEDLPIEEKFCLFATGKEGHEPGPQLVEMFMQLLSQPEEEQL
jgi:exonuclease SbcD